MDKSGKLVDIMFHSTESPTNHIFWKGRVRPYSAFYIVCLLYDLYSTFWLNTITLLTGDDMEAFERRLPCPCCCNFPSLFIFLVLCSCFSVHWLLCFSPSFLYIYGISSVYPSTLAVAQTFLKLLQGEM